MKTSVNSYGVFLETLGRAKSEANRPNSAAASNLSIGIIKTLAELESEQMVTSLAVASSIPLLELVPKLQELSDAGLVEMVAADDKVRITDLGRKVAALAL